MTKRCFLMAIFVVLVEACISSQILVLTAHWPPFLRITVFYAAPFLAALLLYSGRQYYIGSSRRMHSRLKNIDREWEGLNQSGKWDDYFVLPKNDPRFKIAHKAIHRIDWDDLRADLRTILTIFVGFVSVISINLPGQPIAFMPTSQTVQVRQQPDDDDDPDDE